MNKWKMTEGAILNRLKGLEQQLRSARFNHNCCLYDDWIDLKAVATAADLEPVKPMFRRGDLVEVKYSAYVDSSSLAEVVGLPGIDDRMKVQFLDTNKSAYVLVDVVRPTGRRLEPTTPVQPPRFQPGQLVTIPEKYLKILSNAHDVCKDSWPGQGTIIEIDESKVALVNVFHPVTGVTSVAILQDDLLEVNR